MRVRSGGFSSKDFFLEIFFLKIGWLVRFCAQTFECCFVFFCFIAWSKKCFFSCTGSWENKTFQRWEDPTDQTCQLYVLFAS